MRVCRILTQLCRKLTLGCPREEGIDYPDGQICPHCPFGRIEIAGRSRSDLPEPTEQPSIRTFRARSLLAA